MIILKLTTSKALSKKLDFSQYTMKHFSSRKSCELSTALFIHVETCRNMLHDVEGNVIGIKNVASTNHIQQYVSFVS